MATTLVPLGDDTDPQPLTAEFALGGVGRSAPLASGWMLGFAADGLWSLNRAVSMGASVGLFAQPWTTVNVDCVVSCPSPNGAFALMVGPTFRLSAPWWTARPYLQVSPQFEYDFLSYPKGTSGPPIHRGADDFLARVDIGLDFPLARHLLVGARAYMLAAPDEFGLGLALGVGAQW
jgi:hypothetical protein